MMHLPNRIRTSTAYESKFCMKKKLRNKMCKLYVWSMQITIKNNGAFLLLFNTFSCQITCWPNTCSRNFFWYTAVFRLSYAWSTGVSWTMGPLMFPETSVGLDLEGRDQYLKIILFWVFHFKYIEYGWFNYDKHPKFSVILKGQVPCFLLTYQILVKVQV